MANILLVDDALDASEALARFLERAGQAVHAVSDGRDALQAVLAEKPDLVILDLLMPEMDGPAFLEIVRSYLRLQVLPVIVLTAVSSGPLLDRARNARVDAILQKSKATNAEIVQAIDMALKTPRLDSENWNHSN
jgi:CheY-like chemotaxis protein